MSTPLITPRLQVSALVRGQYSSELVFSEWWVSSPIPGQNEEVAARFAREGFWTPEPHRDFYPPQVILRVRIVPNQSVEAP